MAQVPENFGLGDLSYVDPTLPPPNYLQWNPLQQQGEAPIPYSPEGWSMTKIAAPTPEAETPTKPIPAQAKKKGAGVSFTPEQAATLAKLVSIDGGAGAGRQPGTPGFAPQGKVGPMQLLQTGGNQTPVRASLGQILYGGRKF